MSVTVIGTGLFEATTEQAVFIRSQLSYSPDQDPRLPKHTALASNLLIASNTLVTTELVLANISLAPQPTAGKRGYLRVGAYVWSYANVHTANSTVSGLANVQPILGGNLTVGTIVSVLGTR
jgi:hypothetical protein